MAKSAHDAWACFMCGTCAHIHIQVTAIYCHSLHKFLELPIVYYDFDIKAPVYILFLYDEVENILIGSLDSIPSPSPSVTIQIIGEKVCLRFKGKTLLGIVNKLLKIKSLLTSPSYVLPYHLK